MRLNLGEKGRQGLREDQEPDQREEKPKYVGDDGDDGRLPDRRRLYHRRPPIRKSGDGRYDRNRACCSA